jgi:hypothetical protein
VWKRPGREGRGRGGDPLVQIRMALDSRRFCCGTSRVGKRITPRSRMAGNAYWTCLRRGSTALRDQGRESPETQTLYAGYWNHIDGPAYSHKACHYASWAKPLSCTLLRCPVEPCCFIVKKKCRQLLATEAKPPNRGGKWLCIILYLPPWYAPAGHEQLLGAVQ